MKQITVDLGERSYPIYIGPGLLGNFADYLQGKVSGQLLVVSNTTVAPLYLSVLQESLQAYDTRTVIIDDGEQFKTTTTCYRIITDLLQYRFDRSCCLLALGGGVVGDITGFAAATYQRGVGYIQVPTTLLAQVDSSVGGKTAVNHELGKNMIGAFHQPRMVISDTSVLETLPDREFTAGLAEIIKYGCIRDSRFFSWLEENISLLKDRNDVALAFAIEQSCLNKAAVVSEDERESGTRALLNLGHTFAHAIETAQGYRHWLHGEAVATGIAMAADLSVRGGLLDPQDRNRVVGLLQEAGLPVSLPAGIDTARIRQLMAVDKKTRSGKLQLVLLQEPGRAIVTTAFTEADLQSTLATHAGNNG